MRARRQGGRRHRFRTFLFVAIPLGALGAAVAYHLVVVATRVESARKTILTASALAERGNIAAADAQLVQAEVKMLEASRVINSSPDIVAVRWIPIIGQNLNSIRDMVGIGFQLVVGGRDILGAARPLADTSGQLQVPMRDGQIPVPVVQATQRAVDDLAGSLPAESDAPHSPFILPPISHLQKRIYAEAGRRKTQFRTVSAGLRLLADMSGANGPRRYLVMVSNEAEMRGTGGMYLHYAVISAADGKFRLDKVGPIDDLRLTQAPTVPTPPDYLQRFNALQPSLLWRNVNLTSDFNAAAPVVEAMYLQSGGDPLDGVIQIDSDGLAAILAGTGPVNVDPLGAVTAQNAVALTLNQEYVAFPDRDVRREFLGDVARATFDKLTTGNYTSLRPLATSLIRAAAARHVLINTTQPDAEKAVQELALDGQPPPSDSDFAELTVQNFSGNKLDYYLDSKLTVRGQRRAG
ncbi:MAG TPA: DUF4012 domain-containing protein, partial [Acidimicrobiales bacterium]|nr:DUF4012 domain-containing protein [Acidimicrobiales bacterium]